ncbi:hypothetical protein PAPYR_3731 [Paratrimastix pyriformis]|uniref:Leucine-rich repeat-containing N-terminal plant-type domain-containing protein n=1 Tax=Paratrimastix pyriformis TaxID=342808 RepID=A0ABQ8ULE7_9EUKA|nr:hypothetical protein PAPYR_3731 [Paratrimastix pyriformis]
MVKENGTDGLFDTGKYLLSHQSNQMRALALFVGFCVSSVLANIDPDEKETLLQFYNNNGGPGWFRRANWASSSDPCDENNGWEGVYCSENTTTGFQHVLGLDFDSNNVQGDLPTFLRGLGSIEALNLETNNITGIFNFMVFLCELPLKVLALKENHLQGSVPICLDDLQTLSAVTLSNNELEGSMSPFEHISSLIYLDLANNLFSGDLVVFDHYPMLVYFNVAYNQLHGTIDHSFSKLSKIQYFNVSHNEFSGEIPKMPTFLATGVVDLSGNSWQCPIPNSALYATASCAYCAPGYAPNTDRTCQPCRAGQATNGSLPCTPCPAGTFAPSAMSAFCSQCPTASFSFTVRSGSSDCISSFILIQFIFISIAMTVGLLAIVFLWLVRRRVNKAFNLTPLLTQEEREAQRM